ncbi:hypothetical protein BDV93DRAFT_528775 [Ceratobasidium sp. AG-I]|nr:hypothetical protein BDV93DRAFT_528775 [Ceratobasidium sp. AG-I]
MQHNHNHKRIAKRILPRFSPTWLGDPAPTETLPGVSAVAPPVAITPSTTPLPTTSAAAVTTPQAPVVTTQQPTTSEAAPTSALVVSSSSAGPLVTESSASSSVLSSVQSIISSSTPVTSSSATPVQQSSAPAQTTAVPTTTRAAIANTTPAASQTVKTQTLTNASGVIIYSIVTPSATPTATATPTPSNTGTIVGAVAGSLVGVVCLIAFVSWIIRQHNRRKQGNGDEFDRQSYLRNSMMIPDNDPGAGRSVIGTQAALALARANTVGPRPPTMIERKPTYAMPNGAPSPSFQPGQVVSYEPGQVVSAPPTAEGTGYPSPMAFTAYTPPAHHHQSELARRPSGAQLLTRQPTNGGMHDQGYGQQTSPGGYSPGGYSPGGYSPDGYYAQDGYTYPMHNPMAQREMVQSVTPFQAQQYAEITRHLEAAPGEPNQDSFHPISPVEQSPLALPAAYPTLPQAASVNEKMLPNPFEEEQHARIDSMPPSLPPLGIAEGLSRTGTPIDPNPQHAHWSYDAKAGQEGSRLSVAGMPAPVTNAPAMPPAAYTRDERAVVVGNGEAMKGRRPVSVVDEDDVYGGM